MPVLLLDCACLCGESLDMCEGFFTIGTSHYGKKSSVLHSFGNVLACHNLEIRVFVQDEV
ncbi:MAG: hypothetical protein K0Q94_1730 [Paenibacillus sp.]|nr:hypothetical protein [Paenibacillus sp.]